jgi:hypothetical protein
MKLGIRFGSALWVAGLALAPARAFATPSPTTAGAAPSASAAPSTRTARGDAQWGKAPDGERGFGRDRRVRDIARLLRSDEPGDREFVAALYALEPDVRVLLALTLERHRAQGYAALLKPSEQPSIELYDRTFRARMRTAENELARQTPGARTLAALLVDGRFRARGAVVRGFEFEARELEAGLAVLFAHLDGFANLIDSEAAIAATRVDLAAARLRAMRRDLEALEEKQDAKAAAESLAAERDALLATARDTDLERRKENLTVFLERLAKREGQLSSALFTTRQQKQLEPFIRERAQTMAQADKILGQVRVLVPDTPEGQKPPADVQALSKSRRYAIAAYDAVGALSYDPLDEELNYFAGIATDFLQGQLQSRPYFDRYLALRGIRSHDHRTYQGRDLTAEERRALDAVQSEPVKTY